ncbi:MAG: type II toxin-antitoxin system PemK/MazF family toxin [Gemmatimonadota bacterium]|nr:type II toxin-antitoxin system PemK/MazF family toxin [Gemmatimonadota bacterium]
MAPLATGGVVLVPFPFSDLSQSKLRPAVVLAAAGRDDYILCQVTSNPYADPLAVELTQASFTSGSLQRTSYARPGKLFTAHASLIRTQIGTLEDSAFGEVVECVIELLQQNSSS